MFDALVAATAGTRGAAAVGSWVRMENASCARRLAAMVTMLDDAHAASGSADREWWVLDNWGAVTAHLGAVQRITPGAAGGLLLTAVFLRDRLPKVAELFSDGLIGLDLVRTACTRTRLVTDVDAQRAVDEALALAFREGEPMSRHRTEQLIDKHVRDVDPQAVIRTESKAKSRSVTVTVDEGSGMAELYAVLFAHDAVALDARSSALADTVCPGDPRTKDQRHADAMGAIAAGADRLGCLCGTADCPAALLPPSTGVVVYVVAHRDTLADPPAPGTPANPRPPSGPDPGPAEPDSEPDPAEPDPNASAEVEAAVDVSVGGAAPDNAGVRTAKPPADPFHAECTGLDGVPPPLFDKPLRDVTFRELLSPREDGRQSAIRPGAMMGGRFLPGAVTRRAALNAKLVHIVHPGQAPPEPRYRPSRKLADFVRCRDQTCRFPGCTVPATTCDVDHTMPWPHGPTQASNLKCLCRFHHLLKTHWGGPSGWRDRQFPDGTVEWTAPDGQVYRTTPGSGLLFPELCRPTAPADVNPAEAPVAYTGGLAMPRRRRTRAQDRARRIEYERQLNALLEQEEAKAEFGADEDTIPPPF